MKRILLILFLIGMLIGLSGLAACKPDKPCRCSQKYDYTYCRYVAKVFLCTPVYTYPTWTPAH